MNLSTFIAELRRRNVIRVAVGYAITAFVVGEAADIFLPALNLPGWTVTLVVALLILGFPIALVLAWTLEITADGVIRDRGGVEPRDEPPQKEGSHAPATGAGAEDAAAPSDKSIAVLAFTDMSPDGDQEYLGDGIAEEIIDALTKLGGIGVAARTSSFAFKDRAEDVREIGRRLGVASVLEGSVRKADNRLRISAQLVSVADGYHLWSERYDRELEDVFEIQEGIARAVVEALRVEILGDPGRLVQASTRDAEAYDHYLKGRHAWRRRYQLGLEAALEHFKRAVAVDSDFAEPWAGITDTFSVMAIYDFPGLPNLRESATESVERALRLGPRVPDVRFAAGLWEIVFGWSAPKALEHFRAAVRYAGRHDRARGWIGVTLAIQGRPEDGRVESLAAVEEAPESSYVQTLHALTCIAIDRDEARAHFELALQLEPTDLISRYGLASIDSAEGRHHEAIEALRYVYERGGRSGAFASFLAGALIRAGRIDEAERILEEVEGELVRLKARGFAATWGGQHDAAIDVIIDLARDRVPGPLAGFWFHWFTPLRAHPRWRELDPYLKGARTT